MPLRDDTSTSVRGDVSSRGDRTTRTMSVRRWDARGLCFARAVRLARTQTHITPNKTIANPRSSQRSHSATGVALLAMTYTTTTRPSMEYSRHHAGFAVACRGFILSPNKSKGDQDQVDELDAWERNGDSADPIDPEVAAEQRPRPDRPIAHAAEGERDQDDDDQGIEDHR